MNATPGGRQLPPTAPSRDGPAHGPERICRQGTIAVQDPRRILECSQTLTQIRFQHLVRRYLSQINYGCANAHCTTPTCYSCVKRNAPRPYRPPTALTGRALAHVLASQPNPHAGLCPFNLKLPPDHVEFNRLDGFVSRDRVKHHNGRFDVFPSFEQLVQQHHYLPRRRPANSALPPWPSAQRRLVIAIEKRRQRKKDTKSLVQNLYNTATVIFYISRQLPDPSAVFDRVRLVGDCEEIDMRLDVRNPSADPEVGDADSRSQNAQFSSQTNRQNVTSDMTSTVRGNQQQSDQHDQDQNASSEDSTADNATDNSQRLLKAPDNPAKELRSENTVEDQNPPAIDGAFDTMRQPHRRNSEGKTALITNSDIEPDQSSSSRSKRHRYQDSERVKSAIHVLPTLDCDQLDVLKEHVYSHCKHQHEESALSVDYDSAHRFRPTTPYVNRSLFFSLSDAETLLKSFRENNEAFKSSPLPHLDSARLTCSFRDWNRHNGALVFDSLCTAVDALFTPPPALCAEEETIQDGREQQFRWLSAVEAAHIVMICIHALTSSVSVGWPQTWAQLRRLRSRGIIVPNVSSSTDAFAHPFMDIIDDFEYEPAMRLAQKLLSGIGARTCFERTLVNSETPRNARMKPGNSDTSLVEIIIEHLERVEAVALDSRRRLGSHQSTVDDPGWTVSASFLEWLRTVMIKKWDTKAEIDKWGIVGTAVVLMDSFRAKYEKLNLRLPMFEMPFFFERLDAVEEPIRFLQWRKQLNTIHILDYPELFTTQQLVTYFRTINFTRMMQQYDHTTRTHRLKGALWMFLTRRHHELLADMMQVTLTELFVLDVSRAEPLKDTLDKLWQQEKRLLLKPLKVNMGQQEGEIGQDHGGVTYEFFRVVLSEAFKPDHGMFTIDQQTRMTWFQPHSVEPLWKFEMIGIIFGLAVYNGITLPVTFPLIFYNALLLSQDTINHRKHQFAKKPLDYIKDGWPDLHKAFSTLLSWTDGDVGDVMMRDYAFSYTLYGQHYAHNMKYPFPKTAAELADQDEPDLVTNANRTRFVNNYIYHLTHASIAQQLNAFKKGFLSCLEPRSLLFFTPSSLRSLIEGSQHISIPDLRRIARYDDGYTSAHSTIQKFWEVVATYDQEDCRRLLEFVTASDRVPVTGYGSLVFWIVKVPGSEALPTSSTCFGKLYLPEYADKESMRRKLEIAIRNARGFGVA